ncbi:MAG: MBL fold metallo-hydrolase [Actinobacteria bacterium]|nr:MBL fold metallo-hydrolase [Actinomycetota bacterium]
MAYLDGGIPPVEEVRPGIWSIPVPMHGPLRYVYVYALVLDDGALLLDAGPGDDAAFSALEAGLATAGLSFDAIRGVLFTHGHLDHYGLAQRVKEASGAWTAMHEAEAIELDVRAYRDFGASLEGTLREFGVGDEERTAMMDVWSRTFASSRGFPPPDRFVGDGRRFDVAGGTLVAVLTPGHAPGHLCFVHEEAGVVFTGDHVLSLTTPNVGISPGSSGSPLADYMTALERVVPYGDLLGLPGHEDPMPVGPRALELLDHHEERLAEAASAIGDGHLTVRSVAERMTWTSPWSAYGPFDWMMAMREAYAHLIVLEARGTLTREHGHPHTWAHR